MKKPNLQEKKNLNKKPKNEAPRNEWLKYYLYRRTFMDGTPWNQAALVRSSGIEQKKLSKILSGKLNNLEVDELVCLSLSLRLTEEESLDLMARFERTLSPENKERKEILLYWIRIYSSGSMQEDPNECMLMPVIEDLEKRNLQLLPCVFM